MNQTSDIYSAWDFPFFSETILPDDPLYVLCNYLPADIIQYVLKPFLIRAKSNELKNLDWIHFNNLNKKKRNNFVKDLHVKELEYMLHQAHITLSLTTLHDHIFLSRLLITAARVNNFDIVQYLREDMNLEIDFGGYGAYRSAFIRGHQDIANYLASTDLQLFRIHDTAGSPTEQLMYKCNSLETVKWLLAHGADPSWDNYSCIELTIISHHWRETGVVSYLMSECAVQPHFQNCRFIKIAIEQGSNAQFLEFLQGCPKEYYYQFDEAIFNRIEQQGLSCLPLFMQVNTPIINTFKSVLHKWSDRLNMEFEHTFKYLTGSSKNTATNTLKLAVWQETKTEYTTRCQNTKLD